MVGAKWTAAEDALLASAVAVHGVRWRRVAAALHGRTAVATRLRWLRTAAVARPTADSSHSPAASPSVTTSPPASSWPTYAYRTKRDQTGGRPWDFYIRKMPCSGRQPTTRQATLLRMWRLDQPRSRPFLCNLHRAERLVRDYLERQGVPRHELREALLSTQLSVAQSDELGLAYWPGDVLHTITRSNSNLFWTCAPGGRRGFLTSPELASLMGLGRQGAVPAARRAGVKAYRLNGWLADSVPHRLAAHCAQIATESASPGEEWCVGSLFSGTFDALAEGFRASKVTTRRTFAAESDELRAEVLSAACAPEVLYPSVEHAARACPPVDALVASPPCKHVSRAGKGGRCHPSVMQHVRLICDTVRRARPRAVIIEQSDGLRTHRPAEYSQMCVMLDELGYVWHHTCVEAHADYRVPHRRKRLLWVGLRVDAP